MGSEMCIRDRGGAGLGLAGQFEAHVPGAEFLEALVDDAVGQFGEVALAAQVAEVQVAQIGGDDLCEGIGGGFVGEVAVPSQDALFEAPRPAGAVLQHLDVVVGFQYQGVGGADPFEHQAGGVAQVRQEPEVAGAGAQEKADRVLRVVRHAEGFDVDVPHLEAGAGGKEMAGQAGLKLVFDGVQRGAVAVNGNVEFLAQGRQALDVVGVFVGDENPRELFRRPADGGESLADLAQAESGVNEQAGFCSSHVGAIAAGAGAQDLSLIHN